jgi:trans-aconitate 2-methyltransferase
VPNSAAEAAFRILADLVASPRWRDRVPPQLPRIEPPGWYLETLRDAGLEVDLWETVYHHQLPSSDAIVEWMKGTALRPALSALAAAEAEAFLAELAARIAPAYPRGRFGVVFPFRRLFFVARRP